MLLRLICFNVLAFRLFVLVIGVQVVQLNIQNALHLLQCHSPLIVSQLIGLHSIA